MPAPEGATLSANVQLSTTKRDIFIALIPPPSSSAELPQKMEFETVTVAAVTKIAPPEVSAWLSSKIQFAITGSDDVLAANAAPANPVLPLKTHLFRSGEDSFSQ